MMVRFSIVKCRRASDAIPLTEQTARGDTNRSLHCLIGETRAGYRTDGDKSLGSILILQIRSFEKQLSWKHRAFFNAYTKWKAGFAVVPPS